MGQVTEKYDLTETDRMGMELGFIWERTLELAWKDLLGKRPGEIEVDGIIGSPDGWLEDTHVLEEYKFTKKSTKWRPADNPRWMLQVKGYGYMLGSKLGSPVTEVRMHILHVNGNYKENVPVYTVWQIRFTEQEIYETWQQLSTYAHAHLIE